MCNMKAPVYQDCYLSFLIFSYLKSHWKRKCFMLKTVSTDWVTISCRLDNDWWHAAEMVPSLSEEQFYWTSCWGLGRPASSCRNQGSSYMFPCRDTRWRALGGSFPDMSQEKPGAGRSPLHQHQFAWQMNIHSTGTASLGDNQVLELSGYGWL